MPTVIANELVGVQPMTGPVGQIHTLRVRYANAMTDNSAAATVSTAAGEEACHHLKLHKHTHSASTVTAGVVQAAQTGYTKVQIQRYLKASGGTSDFSIQILKQAVEAKTRKLQARWTFEAAQDAQAMHGIDVEAEIMAALGSRDYS